MIPALEDSPALSPIFSPCRHFLYASSALGFCPFSSFRIDLTVSLLNLPSLLSFSPCRHFQCDVNVSLLVDVYKVSVLKLEGFAVSLASLPKSTKSPSSNWENLLLMFLLLLPFFCPFSSVR
eukprot:TRINITY_DN1649_c0_g1_i1.p1 TRINITY_DN1649_c0_g1~~TRINITY_DN1649_c0_g1_i1.p1  ORF type:complete len:122 (-),score=3.52 TRINITY_DN1649_c0_g1_i1:877-1242(-)